MGAATVQVNVRLAPEELEVVDRLRRSDGTGMSRAELVRSLIRDRQRAALDEQIAAAYDASGPHDDGFGEVGAAASAETLADL